MPSSSSKAHAALDRIAKAFDRDAHVTRESRQGFGHGALKVKGKIFAMVSAKGQLVVKLPRERVAGIVKSGAGRFFQPGPGRRMKEWLAMSREPSAPTWLELAREARDFVGGSSNDRRAAER